MDVFLVALALSLLGADATTDVPPTTHPILPGLTRGGLGAVARGRVLLGELGCTACHVPGAHEGVISRKAAPELAAVGARVRPEHLRAFIAAPRSVKPGTTMPDLLAGEDETARASAAEALTHFLVSQASQRLRPEPPDRVAVAEGRRLYREIACVACHDPRDDEDRPVPIAGSVPLGRLEEKYSVGSLAAFLEAPQRVRPAGRMPDFRLSPSEAYEIANYLLRDVRVPGPLRYTLYLEVGATGLGAWDAMEENERQAGIATGFDLGEFAAYRDDFALRFEGFLEVALAGDYAFRLATSALGELRVGGTRVVSLDSAGEREGGLRLEAGLHPIELRYVHRRGTPVLRLEMSGPGIEWSEIPGSLIRSERSPAPAWPEFIVDAQQVARGRVLYDELRCGRCHASPQAETGSPPMPTPPLDELDSTAGCLSAHPGAVPDYGLSREQIAAIRAALAASGDAPTREERIRMDLARFGCIACHARGDFGGPEEARSRYFTTADVNLGETGRLPPPLTGAGAKLAPEWLEKAIGTGQSLRPYMSLRMPAFGPENATRLAALLALEDAGSVAAVDWAPPPQTREEEREIREMGRTLVGDAGMRCIACHTFRGRAAGTMSAIDLIETTTQRLRKDWFYRYLLEPARFRAETIMPIFFPDGQSIFTDYAGGDPKSQLDAIWQYLAEGRNTREPDGLRRPPIEIGVGEEAVMLRRSAQGSSKRAISVGYPLGWNLVFDAESVSLEQLWRGKFIDAMPVWTGQGSGAVRILSQNRVHLGHGPPFAKLDSPTAPWPTESSRDLGIRFRGYELDAKRRPTFEYRFEKITIRDALVDLPGPEGKSAFLRRTLTVARPEDEADARELFLRLALHAEIEQLDDGAILVARHFRIRARGGAAASSDRDATSLLPTIRAAGDAKEAIVAVPATDRDSSATLIIDYEWSEESR